MKVVRKSGVEVKLDIIEMVQERIADYESRECSTPLDTFIKDQKVNALRSIHEEILNMSTACVTGNN